MPPSSALTNEIVKTVADYEKASPEELPALAEKLNAETFQQLVSPEGELTEPLSFEYLFYDITVLPDGEVIVTP